MVYTNVHFPIKIQEMKKKVQDGYTYDVDWDTKRLLCHKAKTPIDEEMADTDIEKMDKPTETETPKDVCRVLADVLCFSLTGLSERRHAPN